MQDGILHGNPAVQRRAMAKAITLLESSRADHREQADGLLTALLPHTGKAFRLGLSGVPAEAGLLVALVGRACGVLNSLVGLPSALMLWRERGLAG